MSEGPCVYIAVAGSRGSVSCLRRHDALLTIKPRSHFLRSGPPMNHETKVPADATPQHASTCRRHAVDGDVTKTTLEARRCLREQGAPSPANYLLKLLYVTSPSARLPLPVYFLSCASFPFYLRTRRHAHLNCSFLSKFSHSAVGIESWNCFII